MSATWFKSTFSGEAQTCVEVAHRSGTVLIRDSKYIGPAEDQPVITVAAAQWPTILDLTLSKSSGVADTLTVSLREDGGATLDSDAGVQLTYNADEWDAFAKGIADGQFNRL